MNSYTPAGRSVFPWRNLPHYRWTVLAFTVVIQALATGAVIWGFPLYVVEIKNAFKVPLSSVMLAIVFMQLAIGGFGTPCGFAMEKFSSRLLVLVGSVLLSVGLILASLATASWQVVALYTTVFPIGLLLAGGLVAQFLVVQWFDQQRGLALGISSTGTALGGVIFPYIIAKLIGTVGWRESLFLSGLVVGPVIAVLGWLVLRRSPEQSVSGDLAAATRSEQELEPVGRSWTTKAILSSPYFWLPIVSLMMILAVYDGVKFSIGDFMDWRGYSKEQAALLVTIASASMVVGKLLIGILADLIPHRLIIWFCSGLLAISLYLLQSSVGELNSIRVAIALLGFAGGVVLPMRVIMLAGYFGKQSIGRIIGLASTFVMLGGFGSYLSAQLRDQLGNYDQVFMLIGALLIVPMLLMAFFRSSAADKKSTTLSS